MLLEHDPDAKFQLYSNINNNINNIIFYSCCTTIHLKITKVFNKYLNQLYINIQWTEVIKKETGFSDDYNSILFKIQKVDNYQNKDQETK